MNLYTPVELPASCVQLTPQSKVLTIGSCFAEHIGERMERCLPEGHLYVNPNGVLYNPGSIYNALIDLMAPSFDDSGHFLFKASDGLWHHWHYSTKFTHPDREGLTSLLRERWLRAKEVFDACDALFITFSTDHVYCINEGEMKGTLVANCHKQPARCFVEEVTDPDVLFDSWNYLLRTLQRLNSGRKVIFTLSPYRYAKYGMHENALSKARQLLLIDELCRANDHVCYFPAYEIITDELRDYRFYNPDLLHPSEQAIDYVWEKFREWAFTPELEAYADDRRRLMQAMQHRPLHPASEEYRKFTLKLEDMKRMFEKKWGQEGKI